MGFTIFLLANGTEELRKIYSIRDISISYPTASEFTVSADASISNVNISTAATTFTVTGE